MAPERNTWTVPEFAEHAGVSEAEVVQAINTGDLAHSESESGAALINNDEQSTDWITSNAPAKRPDPAGGTFGGDGNGVLASN